MAAQKIIGGGALKLYIEETRNPNRRPILFILMSAMLHFWKDSKRFNQELHNFVTNNS